MRWSMPKARECTHPLTALPRRIGFFHMRTARRTGHSHNTHSGSSLSSSSLRGVTSIRLTQQNRSREWAAALSALLPTHTVPFYPIAHSWQLVARLRRRIQHDTNPRLASSETHSRARTGGRVGCCVVGAPNGSQPAAPGVPLTIPPLRLRAPRGRSKGGGYRPPRRAPSSPRYRARRIAAPTKVRGGGSPRRPSALPKPCAWVSACIFRRRPARFRPSSRPSPLSPPNYTPSTRAVLAAPLSVTRDTRTGSRLGKGRPEGRAGPWPCAGPAARSARAGSASHHGPDSRCIILCECEYNSRAQKPRFPQAFTTQPSQSTAPLPPVRSTQCCTESPYSSKPRTNA